MSRTRWMTCLMCLVAVGCGDRPIFGPIPDANRTDAFVADADTHDAAIDAGRDGGHDADLGDTGPFDAHVGPDTGLDAGFDGGIVIVPDTGVDGGHDGGIDGGSDAGHDAGIDGGSDAGHDGGNDAGSDGGHDGGNDGGNDGGPDAGHLGPAPVVIGMDGDLASAAGYLVLAESGITNVLGSIINGNVGISPAAASNITGFGLILDSSGVFSSSPSVVAPFHVYAADYATPTHANLISAVGSMQAAYLDAAGRTGGVNDLLGGTLAGTLAPGLYHWASSVNIPLGLVLSGGANDVWIFQVQDGLVLGTNANITLIGGAQASNVFWQVAGQVTTGTSSHFEGIILSATSITLQTGASLHGRALAQTLVALDNNGITAP